MDCKHILKGKKYEMAKLQVFHFICLQTDYGKKEGREVIKKTPKEEIKA